MEITDSYEHVCVRVCVCACVCLRPVGMSKRSLKWNLNMSVEGSPTPLLSAYTLLKRFGVRQIRVRILGLPLTDSRA